MASPAYRYAGTVLRVHDGDTLRVRIDLGFSVHVETDLRLLGCNARELAEPGGEQARANLEWVTTGRALVVETVRPDKYGGRYDAAITLPDGTDLVAGLIAAQWAAAWDGRGPKPVPPWPRPATMGV